MTGRIYNRLTATKVAALKEPGRYADGGGLYLHIDETRRRWLFRYSWRGTRCELGLGSARVLSLAKAREQAAECRELMLEGRNPRTVRARSDRAVTFGDFADEYVETMSPSWRNPKHVAQWKMTLEVYAAPFES